MWISKLTLTNFRNYSHLELNLPPHIVVLQGSNAQGKTNLLEALYMLTITRSHRAINDRELVNWQAREAEEVAVTRLFAEVKRAKDKLQLEISLKGEPGKRVVPGLSQRSPSQDDLIGTTQKRIRINGVVRRALDLVGKVNIVLFEPQDINLITGAPAARRRYLDLIGSQIDSHYLRLLQRYNRILQQRNHLLRAIQEHRAETDQLEFWDKGLVEMGSHLTVRRQQMVAALSTIGEIVHGELTGGLEKARIVYLPSISNQGRDLEAVAQRFHHALHQARGKEIALGMTLTGPHRDDFRFLINDMDMSIYGSRGQQRTIALSLKLAEVRYLQAETGDYPILLLDDVLSEIDLERRRYLQQFIIPYEQVIITTTDLDRFEPSFLAQALQLRVRQGKIEPIS